MAPDVGKSVASRTMIRVFDFFSGCGGTSEGLRRAGMDIVLGLDCDLDAALTFTQNFPSASFLLADIRRVKSGDLRPYVQAVGHDPVLFCGCAPCQPFSKQPSTKKHPRRGRTLLNEFARFVVEFRPHFVLCENVPGLQKVSGETGPFASFCAMLRKNGYEFDHRVIECQDFGVPQMRRRLVLLASRVGAVKIPPATHGPKASRGYSTVGEWIRDLPRLRAGQASKTDHVHTAMNLSTLNLKRIKATPAGGSRLDWPRTLRLKCHADRERKNSEYRGHTDVYGRMRWDRPAPALTTRCISLSNGRYGHPTQDRAISAREAACLQTFPLDFQFAGSVISIARQVGNAVPVVLAETLGKQFVSVLDGDDRSAHNDKE